MKTKFFDRVKRFFRALNARITEDEKLFIEKYLEENQQKVFYSMSIIDQRHCLDVANTIYQTENRTNEMILKLALLHDIGKQLKPFSLIERTAVVLFPRKIKNVPFEPLKNNLLIKAWQLKYWHPEYGARLAEEAKFDPFLVELIRYHHHLPPRNNEIEIFQWADNLN